MKPILSVLLSIVAVAQFAHAGTPIRERIEWTDIWITDADKHDLPRVLLIGDSITRGYFGEVEGHLAGRAYCARLTTSKCVSDPAFSDEVQLVLKQYRFAVIHFNNGLHGWGYAESQYRDGLLRLMETFKEHAGAAKLIWATTTPVRERDNLQQISQRTERVKTRNAIAAEIMKERGIPTDDLYGLVEAHPEFFSGDGVHYNGKGREAQGKQVAQSVLGCLEATDSEAGAHLPPIECPLHKAGIDPTKLKPFAEVEKYIQFLQRPDRAKWQKPDQVVKKLGLHGTETVVDLGAGSGYFTLWLSKAVPHGKVIAIDVQPEMVRHVHRKVITGEWPNVRAQLAQPDDPELPSDANVVFVCDVLMHVPNKSKWLKTVYSEMQRGARLVLIEFREGHLPQGPPEAVKVSKAEILRLCDEAGFRLMEDHSDLLPYQTFLVFVK